MRPLPRRKQQPLRKTSPPLNELMKTSSSGCGMSNSSPYNSCRPITSGCGTPRAIGCEGFTVQTSSRSEPSRQRRLQLVPMRLVKTFDRCPEWSTINPMPASTRVRTRATVASVT
jgi:hypothetical protein